VLDVSGSTGLGRALKPAVDGISVFLVLLHHACDALTLGSHCGRKTIDKRTLGEFHRVDALLERPGMARPRSSARSMFPVLRLWESC